MIGITCFLSAICIFLIAYCVYIWKQKNASIESSTNHQLNHADENMSEIKNKNKSKTQNKKEKKLKKHNLESNDVPKIQSPNEVFKIFQESSSNKDKTPVVLNLVCLSPNQLRIEDLENNDKKFVLSNSFLSNIPTNNNNTANSEYSFNNDKSKIMHTSLNNNNNKNNILTSNTVFSSIQTPVRKFSNKLTEANKTSSNEQKREKPFESYATNSSFKRVVNTHLSTRPVVLPTENNPKMQSVVSEAMNSYSITNHDKNKNNKVIKYKRRSPSLNSED
jgi:hypothetical protein